MILWFYDSDLMPISWQWN